MLHFIAVITALTGVLYWLTTKQNPDEALNITVNSTYDYIVVGSGSAGAVIANILSEDHNVSVLVLETGGSELNNDNIRVPLQVGSLQMSNEDWAYFTVPQKYSHRTMIDQKSFWPRGRVLGGSSSINYLTYARGSRHDFDQWSTEGCTGWSYTDVLPYFLKMEDIQIPDLYNSRYAYMQTNTKDGERYSTAKAYLRPVLKRTNLHIGVHSYGTKVLIEQKKAIGVEFINNNRKTQVFARKEVIVSAGAVNSPTLLMLSGIGPRKHLQDIGIPLKADLPVGENLEDHIMFFMKYKINQSYTIKDQLKQTGSKKEFTILNILSHPRSKGSIRLKSADPFDHPIINPNYLQHPDDVKILISAIRKSQQIVSTKALKEIDATLNAFDIDGICDKDTFDSDSYWECMLRHLAVTVNHPVSTCRMGGFNDTTAVVDPQLRVRGIKGLRVADCSVVRRQVSGNTNAPCIMIGEKAADLIRGKDTVGEFRQQIKSLKLSKTELNFTLVFFELVIVIILEVELQGSA
ncbi:oxygen-dependent choline dehydrogenase-like [Mytilus trossulus]|uniref:oxygen-dependent choline dehydrogenase-like n=1 Tax=Mytilus trossulus TaxID=6551 RepID=UPI003006289E